MKYRPARARLLALACCTLTGVAACGLEDPAISTGALEDAGDELPPGADGAPGAPDAHVVAPDAAPALPETLTVSFDTTSNGGQYSPKNIVAVWIEDGGGVFQKTIGRWAGTRRSHLVGWIQKAGQGDVDAVSGATRSSHNTRLTVHWDFKNKSGQLVPDGAYTIRIELADRNAILSTQNRQGTFTLQKNGTASTQTVSAGGFNNVTVEYSGR